MSIRNIEENVLLYPVDPVLCLSIVEIDFKSTMVVMGMHINAFILIETL